MNTIDEEWDADETPEEEAEKETGLSPEGMIYLQERIGELHKRIDEAVVAQQGELKKQRDALLKAVRTGKVYFDLIENHVPDIISNEAVELTEHGTLRSNKLDEAFEAWRDLSEEAIALCESEEKAIKD
jgi:hypothetical protein